MEGRTASLTAGIRIEVITVLWMVLESMLSIESGVKASSILLIAFGLDSVIELISAGVLLWRLAAERSSYDVERVERIERRATQISAFLLILLCGYVLITCLAGLWGRIEPESSPIGMFIACGAIIIMPWLARRKSAVNAQLDSAALRADIAESVTCAYMAGTVLAGLVLNALLGWWWAEYAAAIVLLFWLAGETKEALEAAREEHDEH